MDKYILSRILMTHGAKLSIFQLLMAIAMNHLLTVHQMMVVRLIPGMEWRKDWFPRAQILFTIEYDHGVMEIQSSRPGLYIDSDQSRSGLLYRIRNIGSFMVPLVMVNIELFVTGRIAMFYRLPDTLMAAIESEVQRLEGLKLLTLQWLLESMVVMTISWVVYSCLEIRLKPFSFGCYALMLHQVQLQITES